MSYLTFNDLAEANKTRVKRWHPNGIEDWSPMEWACAAAGEMGEVCNAVKKLKRIEDKIANLSASPDRQLSNKPEAILAIGDEIADTVISLDLLAQRLGIDIASFVRAKFNQTSVRYGFPEKL
jgi:NTP pyrophosphatase (non-canonical NTP hydrolase)